MTSAIPERVILVALVDDDPTSREHAKLLTAQPGVTVIAAEATLSVTVLTDEQPDEVLVEAGLPDVLPLPAAVIARRVIPDAGVVITDLVPSDDNIADFVKAGVAGFVLKEATIRDLADTMRSVAHVAHVLPDELTTPLFMQIAAEGIVLDVEEDGQKVRARVALNLTLREQEVVALIGKGLANKEIAARLFISTDTVKSHVRSAMDKTGLHSRLLLAAGAAPADEPRRPVTDRPGAEWRAVRFEVSIQAGLPYRRDCGPVMAGADSAMLKESTASVRYALEASHEAPADDHVQVHGQVHTQVRPLRVTDDFSTPADLGTARLLADLAQYQAGAVVSRAVLKRPSGTVTAFAFDHGEGLSEHTAAFDALVIMIEGIAELTVAGLPQRLVAGHVVRLPAGRPHALKGLARFKMLLVMIRE